MATIFSGDAKTAWSIYLRSLEDFLGGSQGYTVVQPLALSERVGWDSVKPNYNMFKKQLSADRMPDWSALANFTGKWVSEGYEQFLSTIQANLSTQITSEQKYLLEDATRRRNAAQSSLERLEKEISYRWEQYKIGMNAGRSPQLNRRQFESSRGYDAHRSDLMLQIRTASGDYAAIINQTGGGVRIIGKAVEDYYSNYSNIPLPSAPEFDTETDRDSWYPFKRQWVDGDIEKFKTEEFEHTIELEKKRTESTTIERHWNGRTGIKIGWFSFGGSAGRSEVETRSSDQTEKITLSFKNMGEFGVFRDRWYKTNLIEQYGNNSPGFWGPNGILNVIPVSYILARGLTIVVTTKDEIKTHMERHFSGGGSIQVGPFNLGGGDSNTVIHSTFESTTTGFKIIDISNAAHIMAVKSFTPFFRND